MLATRGNFWFSAVSEQWIVYSRRILQRFIRHFLIVLKIYDVFKKHLKFNARILLEKRDRADRCLAPLVQHSSS
ncbi:hypothetical protein HNY73_010264 [Argiope bruennichi]|uniref:Uncharacterized protein n=1 Tax=Argiope bruennichi TaxID=94029 RepID=A0A8T0F2C0_ARGBR|nr:hypothetical protein HNY73_010264 [Argiope bruennichi]